ncbi:MAG: hypothetical protein ACI8PZ_006773 [Myxococcota bacterium]|jgi:hypothetical protein
MLALLATLAFAQVPEGVDLEDLDRWDAGAEALLDGPAGCWEIVGKATWAWDFGRFGMSRGDAAFVGRFDNGVWKGFHIEPLGEITREGRTTELRVYNDEPRFAPMFGKLKGGSITVSSQDGGRVRGDRTKDNTPGNLLREALDELSTDVETAYAQWDSSRGDVVYLRVVPLNERNNAPDTEVATSFPGGGAVATRMVVTFPESFKRGTFPGVRIMNATAQLTGKAHNGQTFPEAEAVSFDIGVLGFRFSGAQTIKYTQARACALPSSAPLDPTMVAPAPAATVPVPVTPAAAAPEPAGPRVITIDDAPPVEPRITVE